MSRILTTTGPPRRDGFARAEIVDIQRPISSVAWGLPELFVISQTVFPALLYLPGSQAIRMPIRVSAFGISLAMLAYWMVAARRRVRPHPSRPFLVSSIIWLALMVVHPTTNTLIAGVAQVVLYLAVIAPLFWAPDLVSSPQRLIRLAAILLVCNGVNSMVGVMQVHDPARWLPRDFSTVITGTSQGVLRYTGADGREIIRPPGLSDSPGGVCGPAAAAGLLGIVFSAMPGLALWQRAASLAFAFAGIAALYLSQVRSSLIVLVVSLLAYIGLLVLQRRRTQAMSLLVIGFVVLLGAFTYSLSLGGDAVFNRFATLFQDDPATTYYKSRGNQVGHALGNHLADYPLGAGLGRWGMMRFYFGDERNKDSPVIWSEIQIPSWILDGGIILIVLYGGGLALTCRYEYKLASQRANPEVASAAALVLATNMGVLALVMSYTPFLATIGVQFWFLSGALHGVNRSQRLANASREEG